LEGSKSKIMEIVLIFQTGGGAFSSGALMTLMSGDKGKVARPKSASSAQSHKSAMQTVTHFSSGAQMSADDADGADEG